MDIELSTVAQGYQKSRVTPYMHIMAVHVPQQIKLHGNIKQFSCQGVVIWNNPLENKHIWYLTVLFCDAMLHD